MTLNLAETSFAKCQPSVPLLAYGANFLAIDFTVNNTSYQC